METSPDRTVVGEYVHHTTLEEVIQLLGHDPYLDPYLTVQVQLDYNTVTVVERTPRGEPWGFITYRHVVR